MASSQTMALGVESRMFIRPSNLLPRVAPVGLERVILMLMVYDSVTC